MEHCICKGGCKGVAPSRGVCQAQDCPRYQMPLEACDCHDHTHHGVFDKNVPKEEQQ